MPRVFRNGSTVVVVSCSAKFNKWPWQCTYIARGEHSFIHALVCKEFHHLMFSSHEIQHSCRHETLPQLQVLLLVQLVINSTLAPEAF